MAQGFVLNGGNYNVLTLQPQPAALAVTTGPGSIHVQMTPPPAAFLEPEVEYWVTHKPGGIPEHPFDGAYQKMATGGGQDSPLTCEITDGVENGVQYGVRVFLRGRYGFQTSRQNAQALVTPQAGIAGRELPAGTLLRLGEGGQGVLFYLSSQDYESANNGLGLMLCTRKDCYNAQSWDQGGNNAYASSSVDSWLVSAYKTMLEPVVCDAIALVKIRYTPGNGNNVVVTLEREVFLPSLTEFGLSHVNANTEGARLPVAASLRAAYTTAGFGRKWTRSPCKARSDEAMYADSYDNAGDMEVTDAYGLLPSFCLPATMRFHPTPNADGSYSPVGSPYAD